MEGIFRRRDGKSLEEILDNTGAGTGGVTMEQVNAAIYQAITGAIKEEY